MVEDVKLRDDLSFEISIRPGMATDVKPFKLVEHILKLEDNQVKLLRILRAEAG